MEHSANTYNEYEVSPDGQTPYAFKHGKNPKEKLVEFWKRVLWHAPRNYEPDWICGGDLVSTSDTP